MTMAYGQPHEPPAALLRDVVNGRDVELGAPIERQINLRVQPRH
jgi:hypothetical protein